jgi:hypothetical protein
MEGSPRLPRSAIQQGTECSLATRARTQQIQRFGLAVDCWHGKSDLSEPNEHILVALQEVHKIFIHSQAERFLASSIRQKQLDHDCEQGSVHIPLLPNRKKPVQVRLKQAVGNWQFFGDSPPMACYSCDTFRSLFLLLSIMNHHDAV